MKTLKKTGLLLLSAVIFVIFAGTKTATAQPGMSVSFQLFYDELAPHGEWIDDPEYGYIWLPNAGADFQPYASNGHWVMTTYGNTWVSNYAWGWAPFHYGRWTHSDYYGWAWVPGYEWGPAWVNWRSGGSHYGWAPLGPRMSINVNIGIPHHHYVFVPQRYIYSPRVYSYYTPFRNRVTIFNRTTIINNTYVYNNRTYVSGPGRSEIERATRSRVSVRDINSASRPGRAAVNNRSVSIYRPEVDRNTRTSARPNRIADASTVRSANNTRNAASTTTNRNRNAASTSTDRTRGNTVATRANERNTSEVRGRTATTPSRNNNTAGPATSSRSERNARRETPSVQRSVGNNAQPAARQGAATPATRSNNSVTPAAPRTNQSSNNVRSSTRNNNNGATTRATGRSVQSSQRNTGTSSGSQSRPSVSSSRSSTNSKSSNTSRGSRTTERSGSSSARGNR